MDDSLELEPKRIKMEETLPSFINASDAQTPQQIIVKDEEPSVNLVKEEFSEEMVPQVPISVSVNSKMFFNSGSPFEGVISFSAGSSATLSLKLASEHNFKVLTANVFSLGDLVTEQSDYANIEHRDIASAKAENNSLSPQFLLCFSCKQSFSELNDLSEHATCVHSAPISENEKTYFTTSLSSVVLQPLTSSRVFVLGLDNIREVALESLKLATRHLLDISVDGNISMEDSLYVQNDDLGEEYSPEDDDDLLLQSPQMNHMTLSHSRNSCKTLKCPKCNWHYKYQQTLEAHMKEKHAENVNSCEFCSNNDPHPKLARGETYSCGYKPFKCEVCNYSTTTKGNLSIHMQSDKHLNNVQELKRSTNVDGCLSDNSVMNSQQNVSSGNQMNGNASNGLFKCPICDFESSTARGVTQHITGEHRCNMLGLQSSDTASNNAAVAAAAVALVSSQQQNELIQSLLLQRQLEAAAASQNDSNSLLDLRPPSSGDGTSGLFVCTLCNKFCSDDLHLVQNHALRDRTALMSQEFSSVNNNTFKCLLCSYSTTLKANFTLHSQTEKHKQKVQIFNHLKEGSDSLDSILTLIHQVSPIQITCNACEFQAKSIGQLNAHLTTDVHVYSLKLYEFFTAISNSSDATFKCKLCDSGNFSKTEIIEHVQSTEHNTRLQTRSTSHPIATNELWQELFQVQEAGNVSDTNNSASSSASDMYGEAFNCPLCSKPSKSRDLLKDHILNEHSVSAECIENLMSAVKPIMTVKPVARLPKVKIEDFESLTATTGVIDKYKCHRCRNEFVHTNDLFGHVRSCLKYTCSLQDCSQSFGSHSDLSSHATSSHTDPDSNQPCWDPKCGQNFLSEENLILHFFETHLIPASTCSRCLTTFLSISPFSSHVLSGSCDDNSRMTLNQFKDKLLDSEPIAKQYSSSPQRVFKCNDCSGSFLLQESLVSHQDSIHASSTGSSRPDKPYRCDVCDVAYSSESTLIIHVGSLLHRDMMKKKIKTEFPARSDSEDCATGSLDEVKAEGALGEQAESLRSQLSLEGVPMTPELKNLQETLSNQQQMQQLHLLQSMDVQTQMNLLYQQQQFLLQQQKMMSSIMPFYAPSMPTLYNCNKCGQFFATQDALTNHQNLVCNVNLTDFFKLQGTSAESNSTATVSSIITSAFSSGLTTTTTPSNTDSSQASSYGCPLTSTSSDGALSPEITTTAKTAKLIYVCKLCGDQSLDQMSFSSHLRNTHNFTANDITTLDNYCVTAVDPSSVTESQIFADTVTSASNDVSVDSANNEDEDDDNMFYNAEDSTHSDIEDSPSDDNDFSYDMNSAVLLQQAALYNQLMLQNPSAFTAMASMLPAMGGMTPQMLASNPLFGLGGMKLEYGGNSPKQPRTKITDEQLQILKQNFDISNSPTEDQYLGMSHQTGLPIKVIKHWFRNTLFKERQKDKDSPYNFSNPPPTSSSANTAMSLQQVFLNSMQSLMPNGTGTSSFDKSKLGFGQSGLGQQSNSPLSSFMQQPAQHNSSKRATRTRFTDGQIKALQDFFDQNPYPRDDDLETLSKNLNLSPRVVVVWFQNQRQKARRSLEIAPGDPLPERRDSNTTRPSSAQEGIVEQFQVKEENISLNVDATKLVQEVVSMLAEAGGPADPAPPMESDNTTATIEPQPAPNTFEHSPSAEFEQATTVTESEPFVAQVTVKEEAGQSEYVNDEFYYTCNFCTAVICSEEEYDTHQRNHLDEALNMSVTNTSTNCDLLAMQRMRDKYSQAYTTAAAAAANNASNEMQANSTNENSDYFRRMRTTISPDQLEVLYEKYGENSNPSRSEMESIAASVGLSRRVVQVWYQNTRARQRRGQCRVIGNMVYHCKCPYCDMICKSKSHLTQHLQKEHIERGKVAPSSSARTSTSNFGAASNVTCSAAPNVTISTKSNQMSSMSSFNTNSSYRSIVAAAATSLASPTTNQAIATDMNNKQMVTPANQHVAAVAALVNQRMAELTNPKSTTVNQSSRLSVAAQPMAMNLTNQQLSVVPAPVASNDNGHDGDEEDDDGSIEMSFFSESDASNEDGGRHHGSSPDSKYIGLSMMNSSLSPPGGDDRKRHRTNLTMLQIRTLKSIFIDYKTPTMTECETIGNELGLSKRVVQVWFQNARSKEKKVKITHENDNEAQLNSDPPNEGCNYCGVKYTADCSVRDHLFTKNHVNKVKQSVALFVKEDSDAYDTDSLSRFHREMDIKKFPMAEFFSPVKSDPVALSVNQSISQLLTSTPKKSFVSEHSAVQNPTAFNNNSALLMSPSMVPMDLSTKSS